MVMLLQVARMLIDVLWWLILVQFILSWVLVFNGSLMQNGTVRSLWQALNALLEPVYQPIRRILPNTGTIDFAPMVVLIAMSILDKVVLQPAIMNAAMA